MPLTEWVCKSCGGIVTVDDSNKHGKCNYCGKEYTEQEIVQYHQHHYHIQKAQINMVNDESVEAKLKSAEVYLSQIKDYEEARKIFTDVSKIQPDNYLCWWGLARIETKEFEDVEFGQKKFAVVAGYVENAFIFVPADKADEIKATWSSYTSRYNDTMNARKAQMNQLNDEIKREKFESEQLDSQIKQLKRKRRFWYRFDVDEGLGKLLIALMIISAVVSIIMGIIGRFSIGIIFLILFGAMFILGHIIKRKRSAQVNDLQKINNEHYHRIEQLLTEYNQLNTFFDSE